MCRLGCVFGTPLYVLCSTVRLEVRRREKRNLRSISSYIKAGSSRINPECTASCFLPLTENTCPSSETRLPALERTVLQSSKETILVSRNAEGVGKETPLRRPDVDTGAAVATLGVAVRFWFAAAAAFRLRGAVLVLVVAEKLEVPGNGVSLFRAFHPLLFVLAARFPDDGIGDCRESTAAVLSEAGSMGDTSWSSSTPLLFTA
jgi:hypothetical protein